jgi:2,4-dienoyl-CoA reductase (NADPH2)
VRLNEHFNILQAPGFDEIIVATGSHPRAIEMEGINHPMVCSYLDILEGRVQPAARIALLGAGGIGIDTTMFILKGDKVHSVDEFVEQWGIDASFEHRGGLLPKERKPAESSIYLLQRKPGKIGSNLGKTTAWIHRLELKQAGVHVLSGVAYHRIHDGGLDISINGEAQTLEVDQVVVCAGQISNDKLYADLRGMNIPVHCIGGAVKADELNAHRAIEEGTLLGLRL